MTAPIELTLGPLFFNWPVQTLADFYARIADESVIDRVYVGEVVCGKRSPLVESTLVDAAERLVRAGKTVVWSTLCSPTNKRERSATASLSTFDAEIEVNDIGALAARDGRPFTAGPMLNIYNETALAALQDEGCTRWCPPVEMSLAAIRAVHAARPDMPIEVFGFGRLPLAHSGRCYHARFHSLNKDSCRYFCEEDPDGKTVSTVDGAPFLAFNGLQTLSDGVHLATTPSFDLRRAGIAAVRLSPHTVDMVRVAAAFRHFLDDQIAPLELKNALKADVLDRPVINGYLGGRPGMEWSTQ